MRWLPTGAWERVATAEALWRAWRTYERGKRRRASVARFAVDADREVSALARELRTGRYEPRPYGLRVIFEPKRRLVAAPALRDRVVHQAVVAELAAHTAPGFVDTAYAGIPGRGTHRAVIRYLGAARRYRYVLRLDIARYFPSVDTARLLDLVGRRCGPQVSAPGAPLRALLERLLASGAAVYRTPLAREVLGEGAPGRGLAVGSYLSQWAGAFYLCGLDHHVKRALRCPAYLRYMDDLVLFDDDRDRLAEWRGNVEHWLRHERGLALNPKHGRVVPTSAPGVFLGYRISPAGLAPGPKLRHKLRRRLREAARRGALAFERCAASYRAAVGFATGR